VQQSTGSHCRVLYGQIFRDGKWCPVKLTETEPDLWPLDWFELTLWDLCYFFGIWKNWVGDLGRLEILELSLGWFFEEKLDWKLWFPHLYQVFLWIFALFSHFCEVVSMWVCFGLVLVCSLKPIIYIYIYIGLFGGFVHCFSVAKGITMMLWSERLCRLPSERSNGVSQQGKATSLFSSFFLSWFPMATGWRPIPIGWQLGGKNYDPLRPFTTKVNERKWM
jgi:hypothetical protein